MANTMSAKKRIRSSARRAERNRFFRSTFRTYVKQTREAIANDDIEQAESSFRLAASYLDKSAQKGIIHKNTAARKKGRLRRALDVAKQSA